MTQPPQPQVVYGRSCPSPRLTRLGAALLALAVAVPGGALVWLVSLLF